MCFLAGVIFKHYAERDLEVTGRTNVGRYPVSDSYNPMFVTEPGLVAHASGKAEVRVI